MASVDLVDKSLTYEEESSSEGNEGVEPGNAMTETPTVIQEENSRKRKESSKDTSDNGSRAVAVPPSKRRQGIGPPRVPPAHLRLYVTSHYELFVPEQWNVGPRVCERFRTFAQFDQYTLFMNPAVERVEDIPTSGVRLDDVTAAFVLTRCTQKTLHANWPAEFDKKGMIRATRMPLGHAAKFWKEEGDVDIDGNVVPKGEGGYYYKWWRGLQCLCGKEGMDRNLYLIRFREFQMPGVRVQGIFSCQDTTTVG